MYYYRRQIKLVIGLLLLAGLVYGGIKGWMYLNVRQAIDEISQAAAGKAEIGYQSIDTELKGVVAVRGVSVLPTGATQPVRIDTVRLSGPRLDYFLWGAKADNQAPPERLQVYVDGISLPLDQQLFDTLREDLPVSADSGGQGCSIGEGLDPAVLQQLGFSQLEMDISLSYDYDKAGRRLRTDMELEIHQLERVQASLALGDVEPDALQGGMNAIPTLAGFSLAVNIEPAFGRRYLAACAKRRGQDTEAYRKVLVNETLASLARAGLQLGPGLTQALRDYHQGWGEVRISAEPASPVNPMTLMLSPPANWMDKLGIKVKLNQREISDLSFEMRSLDPGELAVLMGEEPPPKPSKPQDRYRYVYHDVPVAALAQHVGAEVRLHLNNDQPTRSGTLQAVVGGEARVEQLLYGGKITAHVGLDEIVRLEVRKVEKVVPTAK